MTPDEEAKFAGDVLHHFDRIATALETLMQNVAQVADDLSMVISPERMGGTREHDAFVRIGTYDLGGDPR